MWKPKRKVMSRLLGRDRMLMPSILDEIDGKTNEVPQKELNGRRAERQTMWQAPADSTWNPLVHYPRNAGCFCGSKEKAKKCCQPNLMRCVSKALAEQIKRDWDSYLDGTKSLPKAPKEQA